MSAASRLGSERENAVRRMMEEDGWVVGSLRHSLGGGDLIAARTYRTTTIVQLVEVKATAGGPYERFTPGERASMKRYATRAGATAMLAYWPAGGTLRWIPSWEWPTTKENR